MAKGGSAQQQAHRVVIGPISRTGDKANRLRSALPDPTPGNRAAPVTSQWRLKGSSRRKRRASDLRYFRYGHPRAHGGGYLTCIPNLPAEIEMGNARFLLHEVHLRGCFHLFDSQKWIGKCAKHKKCFMCVYGELVTLGVGELYLCLCSFIFHETTLPHLPFQR